MTFKQRRKLIATRIFSPLIGAIIGCIWHTCKIKKVIGEEHLQALLDTGEAFIPCHWHQQQIFAVKYLLDTTKRWPSLNLGCLISPSADGDIASRLLINQNVHIIRGSATRGGAQTMRNIYTAIKEQKISPIVAPDGPTGPIYQCKLGVVMLAQLSHAPLLPVAYSGTRIWRLKSWDNFMLPMPFSSIVMGIGPALVVDKSLATKDFAQTCQKMTHRLNSISMQCEEHIRAIAR